MPFYGLSFAALGMISAAFIVLLLMLHYLHSRTKRRLVTSCLIFLFASAFAVIGYSAPVWLGFPPDDRIAVLARQIVSVIWWLTLANLSIRSVDLFLWRGLFGSRPVPKLLKDVLGSIIYLIALFAIVAFVFEQPVTGLLATSGVVAVVLGFALQNTLGDVFSGIALNMEHPYRQGDWIQLDNGVEGEVVEINWRATHLRSRQETEIIQPNSGMATSRIINYHYPSKTYALNIQLRLDYKLPPSRAKAIIKAAALAYENTVRDPAPIPRIWDFEESTVLYDVKVWVVDFARHLDHIDAIYTKIWEHLRWAGVTVAFPQRDIHFYRSVERDQTASLAVNELLRQIELFSKLEGDELAELAHRMHQLQLRPGRNVVVQGQAGSSLFIVAEGLLDVRVKFDNDDEQSVAHIGPGNFFGEMSLLTGVPRSATVTTLTDSVIYEVDKDHIEPILKARPEIAEVLVELLDKRRQATEAAHEAASQENVTARAKGDSGYAEQMLGRIRNFFQL